MSETACRRRIDALLAHSHLKIADFIDLGPKGLTLLHKLSMADPPRRAGKIRGLFMILDGVPTSAFRHAGLFAIFQVEGKSPACKKAELEIDRMPEPGRDAGEAFFDARITLALFFAREGSRGMLVLKRASSHPAYETRAATTYAYATMAADPETKPEALAVLLKLASDSNAFVRARALSALAKFIADNPQVRELLLQKLHDSEPEVLHVAVDSICRQTDLALRALIQSVHWLRGDDECQFYLASNLLLHTPSPPPEMLPLLIDLIQRKRSAPVVLYKPIEALGRLQSTARHALPLIAAVWRETDLALLDDLYEPEEFFHVCAETMIAIAGKEAAPLLQKGFSHAQLRPSAKAALDKLGISE